MVYFLKVFTLKYSKIVYAVISFMCSTYPANFLLYDIIIIRVGLFQFRIFTSKIY